MKIDKRVLKKIIQEEIENMVNEYEMGVKPLPGYTISRWNYDPEIPF